jgi:hypothetical protein
MRLLRQQFRAHARKVASMAFSGAVAIETLAMLPAQLVTLRRLVRSTDRRQGS